MKRQAAEVGRAAGDRVCIAIARLPCTVEASNRAALDNAAGTHERDRIGDLGSNAEIMGDKDIPMPSSRCRRRSRISI